MSVFNPGSIVESAYEHLPLHAERPEILYGGVAAFAVGTALSAIAHRQWRNAAESEFAAQPYPDPEQSEAVAKSYKKAGRNSALQWVVAGTAALTGSIELAKPYHEVTTYSANNIAVVIEAGADSRAKDVADSNANDGSKSSRLQGSMLSSLELVKELDGKVKVNVVLAGTNPESMGEMSDKKSEKAVFENAAEYLQVYDNAGEPNIEAGIAVARATNPDKIVVFTEDSSDKTREVIREAGGDITVISVGKPGTTYTFLGQKNEADYTNTFGDVQAKSAASTDEISAILKSEVADKITQKDKDPIGGYGKIAAAMGVLSLFIGGFKALKFPRKVK